MATSAGTATRHVTLPPVVTIPCTHPRGRCVSRSLRFQTLKPSLNLEAKNMENVLLASVEGGTGTEGAALGHGQVPSGLMAWSLGLGRRGVRVFKALGPWRQKPGPQGGDRNRLPGQQ